MITEPQELRFSIPRRFNGPPASAHGGYACGSLARLAETRYGPNLTVSLQLPPPLDEPLLLQLGPRRGHALAGDQVIATVGPSTVEVAAPEPVSAATATAAERGFAGRSAHPFPTCFVCGGDRSPADGLRLRPGPVAGRPDTVACGWLPPDWVAGADGAVAPEHVWSVLDCPGGWTGDPATKPAVLGRLTVRIRRLPRIGEPCVLVARLEERRDRAALNSTGLYTANGELLGSSSALWLRTDPAELASTRR
jgi:hypothetical protein